MVALASRSASQESNAYSVPQMIYDLLEEVPHCLPRQRMHPPLALPEFLHGLGSLHEIK